MRGIKVLKRTGKKGVYVSGGVGGSAEAEFRVGRTYKLKGAPKLCKNGFHFFRYEDFCFGIDYYSVGETQTVYVEIEAVGEIESDTCKCVSNEIKIIRVIPKKEWAHWIADKNYNSGDYNSGYRNSGYYNSGYRNSGDSNSGYRNSGDSNSGDYNSGYRNSGDSNSGDYNSGDYNSGDYNSGRRNSGDWNSGSRNSGDWNSCSDEAGFFNSMQSKTTRVFNKECLLSVWKKADKPSFIFFDMNADLTYKENFILMMNAAKQQHDWGEQLKLLEALPNFDWIVFEEISGISKEMAYKKGEKK